MRRGHAHRELIATIAIAAPFLFVAGPASAQQGWVVHDDPVFHVWATLEGSQALLVADDGVSRETNLVDNEMIGNTLGVFARSRPFGNWSSGANVEWDFYHLKSDSVSQSLTSGGLHGVISEASLWLRNRRFGTLIVGLTGGASDGIGEYDASETDIVSSVNLDDVGGGYVLRGAGGAFTEIAWSDAFDSLDNFGGPSGEAVRYESPHFKGFQWSAAVGEQGIWDTSIRYEREFVRFTIDGGVSLFHQTSTSEELESDTYLGSISMLHKPTGLSFALAAGRQSFNEVAELNDDSFGALQDRSFVYGKAALRRSFFDFGRTSFFAEAGRFTNGIGVDADGDDIAVLLGSDPEAICEDAGEPCLVSSSDGSVWGAGVIQYFAPHISVYAGYRHYDLDLGLVDEGRAPVAPVPTQTFDTTLIGFSYRF